MTWPKFITDHLRGTLEILDDIHAEPDELFKIGIVISRLENAIELMEKEEPDLPLQECVIYGFPASTAEGEYFQPS